MFNDFPLLLGIVASTLHIISGPDHLAAVTPYAIETKQSSWKVGLYWGLGHLGGMLLIGFAFLLFKAYIPIEQISEHSETLVGITLVGIGAFVIYKTVYRKPHAHVHPKKEKYHIYSLAIGFLHGLAGIAHFILLLPVLGFENRSQSVLYIIGFGIGTVAAMSIYALIVGKASQLTKRNGSLFWSEGIRLTSGFFALVTGFYLVYLGVH